MCCSSLITVMDVRNNSHCEREWEDEELEFAACCPSCSLPYSTKRLVFQILSVYIRADILGEHNQRESKLISWREVEYMFEKLTLSARRVIIIIPIRYHTELVDERTEFLSYIAIWIIKLIFYKLVKTS